MSTPTPKPGPRPGTTASPAAKIPHNDPARHGRVDADGTAWVYTRDGERQIGQFHAGSPEEGLQHFGAKYVALSTEIAVLEARLRTHPHETARIEADAAALHSSVPHAAVIGDLEALSDRLERLRAHCGEVAEDQRRAAAEHAAQAEKKKRDLAAEAEKLGAESTDWKKTGDRFRQMVDEWRNLKGVPKTTDDELYTIFSAGRKAFNERRQAHFDDLDRQRAAARVRKEALIEKAESLQHSTDWAETSRAYRDLMREWKAAGRAPRDVDDQLWSRFRAAQDVFFAAKKNHESALDEEFAANAEAKQKLIDDYSPLIDPAAYGLDRSRQNLRELQDAWDAIGFVPRDRKQEFEDKIGALEARVADAADEQWRKTDPEAQARVAQFRSKVEQLEADARAAEAQGKAGQAKKLAEQAAQWREWAEAAEQALEN